MNIILGISASSGISTGKAFVIPEQVERIIPQFPVSSSEIEKEWERFSKAKSKITDKILKQLEGLSPDSKQDKIQKELLETYLLMLDDPVFLQEVRQNLEENPFNIEYILDVKTEEYADRLRNSGNEYLTERAQDICDIFGSVLNELLNIHVFNIEQVPDGAVIVARDLSPSDAIIFTKRKIAGLALAEGGTSSHVAILARNYGIPAVFALENITKEVLQGSKLIVDGTAGEVIVSPDIQTLSDYTAKIEKELEHKEKILKFKDIPAQTKDGTRFTLLANIGTPEEAKLALDQGADGIGLFRTEFLFMQETTTATLRNHVMTEDEQFDAYRTVLETMKDKPVTIRTLDAGGDKIISSLELPTSQEKNPLMGLRAIRLTLNFPKLFKTQLRALYRASVYGNLKIMLPLITTTEQVVKAKELISEVQAELENEGIPFNKDVPVGIMVETAAAGITADCFAKISDFFSIGTNDLTQYTLGVDRENLLVSPLYNEFHLAVLRLIQHTIEAAESEKIPVSVCGEMAGKTDSVLILAGMGIRTLSMGINNIPYIKELLSSISIAELQSISAKSLNNL
ncbi:MAG: phosphoenolpyruvate--protein phosphotransferase [Treponema sp.]|uniref:phosphoenolpyruvate--protein phosphotransferase n=1 Tax=Treponema sp. TaxID=166 RepID=UPI001DB7820F|nr:phosphoenolpyruvate--protein phosphotransferase [Treponema sp.]MBS7310675.1 phosphoenolpyruvate--protein phosphotransferase [Treponema sp.]MDY5886002.1 phosphoenolpyruvate--protein phosphotransferase [Treponema sp.]